MSQHSTHSQHTSHDAHTTPSTDRPGTHGMLMFGEATVYLSHLPMFMSPHDYQVILEVSLAGEESDPQAIYVNDRQTTGEKTYTLRPESFVLPDLVSPDPEHPRLSSFAGIPFRGHFERGGKPLPIPADQPAAGRPTPIRVDVTQVVHFDKLDPDAAQPRQLEYLLFGKGKERFLAHVVTSPPDFDQILSVMVTGGEFTDEELRQGVRVSFPGRANSAEERIMEGETATGTVQVAGDPDPEPREIQCEAGVEFYFEEDELAHAM